MASPTKRRSFEASTREAWKFCSSGTVLYKYIAPQNAAVFKRDLAGRLLIFSAVSDAAAL
uniref:Uncharacterized protein n=1 Tax=Ciona intestinalis TaxID=7719 RepID=H2XQ69_CIOIN